MHKLSKEEKFRIQTLWMNCGDEGSDALAEVMKILGHELNRETGEVEDPHDADDYELSAAEREFAAAEDARNEWGFYNEECLAIADCVEVCSKYNMTFADAVAALKGKVAIPKWFNDTKQLIAYFAYRFENCNYHGEAVLVENLRYREIRLLHGGEEC